MFSNIYSMMVIMYLLQKILAPQPNAECVSETKNNIVQMCGARMNCHKWPLLCTLLSVGLVYLTLEQMSFHRSREASLYSYRPSN